MAPPIRILTDPLIAAPLLIALLYYPNKLRQLLPTVLRKYTASPGFIRALKLCIGFSIARNLNGTLSHMAINNWRPGSTWGKGKEKELVLITGGSSGFGECMARKFVERGVEVVVIDLKEPKTPFPPAIHHYTADVSSPSSISSIASEIRMNHGDPTVLINNAGVATFRTVLDESEDAIKRTFEVNALGMFWVVREFLPRMIERDHGHVVNIASVASFIAPAQLVDYACSKSSVMAFHEGLSTEMHARYKAPHVRTTIVHPGWSRTPLLEEIYSKPKWHESMLEPEVVAQAVVKQVLSGQSGVIIIPKLLGMVSVLRALPFWLQIPVRNAFKNTLDVLE
ncbi:short chain dehydrogenase/reductase [Tricladium varicosporioides]|nr:short chain dehydrogenase/reductase [Hymenoscyphus varicosporioides]